MLRPVTLDLCCLVLRGLILALEADTALHERAEQAVDAALLLLSAKLGEVVHAGDMFLEMFEEEHFRAESTPVRMGNLAAEPGLYLPPTTSALSNLPLAHRLPCGNEEKVRRSLQFFFLLRKFANDLKERQETVLPLSSQIQAVAEVGDCINLNNSDLLSCSVTTSKGERSSKFLVTDQFQLILVEPDSRKLGWAIVCFAGLLQVSSPGHQCTALSRTRTSRATRTTAAPCTWWWRTCGRGCGPRRSLSSAPNSPSTTTSAAWRPSKGWAR